MKKEVVVIILAVFLLSLVSANSVDNEIQKITHYAEDYETGNINYIQLLLHVSAIRENLNEVLGASGKEYGGILKQDQIKAVLGEPDREKSEDIEEELWESKEKITGEIISI